MFKNLFKSEAPYRDVQPADVAAAKGARIIDVREPSEFHDALGHIPGAELVPLGRLSRALESAPRDQELFIVCRSGGRSARASSELAGLGFSKVHNMVGGMMRWNQEGRPVER